MSYKDSVLMLAHIQEFPNRVGHLFVVKIMVVYGAHKNNKISFIVFMACQGEMFKHLIESPSVEVGVSGSLIF